MKNRRLIYSKMYYFNGRYRHRYIEDKEGRPHAIRIFSRYTVEVSFMPYTWGVGISVTWRKDFKSLQFKVFPFSVAIMEEEDIQ